MNRWKYVKLHVYANEGFLSYTTLYEFINNLVVILFLIHNKLKKTFISMDRR